VVVKVDGAPAPESVVIEVDEAALSGGNEYDDMGSSAATVAFSGYVIIEGGEGGYGVVAQDEDSGEWVYTLENPYTDGTNEQDGRNKVSQADEVSVKVQDESGNSFEAKVIVTIKDDVPSMVAKGLTIKEGETAFGSITYSYGADVPADPVVVISKGTKWDAGWYETEYGWVRVSEDGKSYEYEAKPDTGGETEKITFTITDADGDEASATVKIKFEAAPVPASVSIEVDEADLSGGVAVKIDDCDIVKGGEGEYGRIARDEEGEWKYTLEKPYTDGTAIEGRNVTEGADEVTISVKDSAGNTSVVTVYVNIIDDIPVISALGATINEGGTGDGAAEGVIELNFGADGPGNVTISNGTLLETGERAGWYKMEYGWVKLAEDLTSYTYEAKPNTAGKTESIVFTITDSEGDYASATAEVKIKRADVPEPITVEVDEAALSGGNVYDGMGSLTARVEFVGYNIINGGKGICGSVVFDDASGAWFYSLSNKTYSDNTDGQDGRNVAKADEVVVCVEDDAGNLFDVEVIVNIKDDVPGFLAEDSETGTIEIEGLEGSFSLTYGADGPASENALTVAFNDDVPVDLVFNNDGKAVANLPLVVIDENSETMTITVNRGESSVNMDGVFSTFYTFSLGEEASEKLPFYLTFTAMDADKDISKHEIHLINEIDEDESYY